MKLKFQLNQIFLYMLNDISLYKKYSNSIKYDVINVYVKKNYTFNINNFFYNVMCFM